MESKDQDMKNPIHVHLQDPNPSLGLDHVLIQGEINIIIRDIDRDTQDIQIRLALIKEK